MSRFKTIAYVIILGMTETDKTIENETRRQEWLRDLSSFVVEANMNTWAADGVEVNPQRPGYKELEYKNGIWLLRDSYTGYFRAPGMTTVYYKDIPAWTMAFGGHGQTEGFEDRAKETFNFLKRALKLVSPELPFRGPESYEEDSKKYTFKHIEGDITDALWHEEIMEEGERTFAQTGIAGIVIHRTPERKPQMPWEI